jgi:hypothetical protein
MGSSASTRKKAVADRIEREYRLYRIVAGDLGEVCKAVAYLGMGGVRPVEAVEAASVDEAVSQMKTILGARLAAMREKRHEGVPTVTEFREAFAALPFGLRETIRNLQIERLNPLAPASALATLARRTDSEIPLILDHLRKAGRKLADLLDIALAPTAAQQPMNELTVLGKIEGTDRGGFPILRFHDELREALATLPAERPATMAGRR